MKLGLAVFAVVVALGASSAEAGLFGSPKKYPKAIDSPIVRPKVKESHKTGSRVKHLMQSGDAALVSAVERA